MSDTTLIKEIFVGSCQVSLLMNEQVPLAEFQNQMYPHVWLLIQQLPLLSNADYLGEFSQISNFLWKGLEFQIIEQIVDYQSFYLKQVELEKKFPSDVFPYRLTDYKLFDVSVMHKPLLENGKLIYFVYHISTGLPYRVICPFPYTSPSSLVHYQTLPLKPLIAT